MTTTAACWAEVVFQTMRARRVHCWCLWDALSDRWSTSRSSSSSSTYRTSLRSVPLLFPPPTISQTIHPSFPFILLWFFTSPWPIILHWLFIFPCPFTLPTPSSFPDVSTFHDSSSFTDPSIFPISLSFLDLSTTHDLSSFPHHPFLKIQPFPSFSRGNVA